MGILPLRRIMLNLIFSLRFSVFLVTSNTLTTCTVIQVKKRNDFLVIHQETQKDKWREKIENIGRKPTRGNCSN